MAKGKIRYTIDLDADLAEIADKFFESVGTSRKQGVERMLSWLVDQDELLQGIVLGNVPERLKPAALKMLLEDLKESDTIPFQHERITGEAAKELPPNFED